MGLTTVDAYMYAYKSIMYYLHSNVKHCLASTLNTLSLKDLDKIRLQLDSVCPRQDQAKRERIKDENLNVNSFRHLVTS